MKLLLKMHFLFWMGLLGFPLCQVSAQEIVWEKEWGLAPGQEQIYKVCPATDGNYLALGSSSKYGGNVGGGSYPGLVVIKFTPEGDTLFMRKLNMLGHVISFLGHKHDNVFRVVFTTPRPGIGSYRPGVIEFTDDGIVLQTKVFEDLVNRQIQSCIQTLDLGLLMVGSGVGGGLMSAVKINFLNELEWEYGYFPPVSVSGMAHRIEPMANGHYLLSGRLGKRIYGYEIDTSGNEVNQKLFYETPSNFVFWTGQAIQGSRKAVYYFGYYLDSSNQTIGCFGSIDSMGHRRWGGETPITNVNDLRVNREGTILVARNGYECAVERLTLDSVSLWKVVLSLNTSGTTKFMNGICFTEPDTGIAFGYYYQQPGNAGNQFWLAKIAGVGTAYDPTHPEDTVTVSAQERLFRPKDAPVLYPNPVCEHFQFSKLTQESVLAVYSIRGEKLFEKPLQPGEKVNATNLPKGIYLYHIQMGKRVFTGKLVKE